MENEKLVERLRESADWPEVRPISASELREAAAALTAAEARIKMLSEAVADEVDRLRPHYLSGTATDIARRQMLDHFAAKFPRALTHGASNDG